MTNPARARLVLRCVADKRLPHHPVARKRDGLGVQTEALPSAWPFGWIRGQRIGKMAASEAVNGKCRPYSVQVKKRAKLTLKIVVGSIVGLAAVLFKHRQYCQELSVGLASGKRSVRMAALQAGNGKCRFILE